MLELIIPILDFIIVASAIILAYYSIRVSDKLEIEQDENYDLRFRLEKANDKLYKAHSTIDTLKDENSDLTDKVLELFELGGWTTIEDALKEAKKKGRV